MSCGNNLKQLGLAFHNRHDVLGSLPPGRGAGGNTTVGAPGGCCWGTWVVATFPYMEQGTAKDIYQNWGGTDATGIRYGAAPNTTNVTTKRYATLTCPSDKKNAPFSNITNHNYAVNFGTTGHAFQASLNGVLNEGIIFPGATVAKPDEGANFGDITDGLSNTLLAAEVLQGQGNDLRGFFWWGDAAGFTTYLAPNSNLPDVIYTTGYCKDNPKQKLPCIGTPTSTNPSMYGSRSWHPGGVQVVMGDGAVKFVPNTININTWRALATARGRETITNF
jgi:hypothetical protein